MRLLRWIIPTLAMVLMLSTAGLVSAQANDAISGIVTDAQTGDPIQGALVEVVSADTLLSAETGVDGTYQILDVPPGEYSITASAAGYENAMEAEVAVSENEGTIVDFALVPVESAQANGAISGTVTDAQTGDPIQGALVEIVDTDTPLSAGTGVDGTYQISDVPAAQYSVTASAAGYENGTEAEVDVPEGEATFVVFHSSYRK